MKRLSFIAALALFMIGASSPSWAWVRFGFRGPRVGVYLGAPYWGGYYGYPYQSYDDPYYDNDPYYYANGYPYAPYYPAYQYAQAPAAAPAPNPNAHADIRVLTKEIKRARDGVEFQYQDGDISQAERDESLRHIDDILKAARAQAAANGGNLTVGQSNAYLKALRTGGPVEEPETSPAPAAQTDTEADTSDVAPVLPRMTPLPGTPVPANEQPRQNLKAVQDKLTQVRALLDKKQAEGNITPAQHQSESEYLNQIEKLSNTQASNNGGKISPRQETALLQELQHVEHVIQNNLVSN